MRKRSIQKHSINYSLSLLLAAGVLVTATAIGSVHLPYGETAEILVSHIINIGGSHLDPANESIIWLIRFPRVILAFMVGAALSASGAAMQGLLKNPLADPYTIGISSGSALGAVVVLYLGLSLPVAGSLTLPIASIIGGLSTLVIVLWFSSRVHQGSAMILLILAGVIISSFFGACQSLLIALSDENLKNIIFWLLGSVGNRGWSYVALAAPFMIIGFMIIFFSRHELNVLSLGEKTAHETGVAVRRRRIWIMTAVTLMSGAAVSVSGTIGFVGLIIPHVLRLLTGPDYRHLLILSAVNGGTFLVLADLAARTVIAPEVLPLGVMTALIGAPAFGVILLYQSRKGAG